MVAGGPAGPLRRKARDDDASGQQRKAGVGAADRQPLLPQPPLLALSLARGLCLVWCSERRAIR